MNTKPLMRFPWLGLALGAVLWLAVISAIPLRAVTDGTTVKLPAPPPSMSDQRDSIVAQEARRAGVSVALALDVSHVENTGGDSMAVSKRGAVGIMQVLPSYWQHKFEDECDCGSLFLRRRNACVGVHVLGGYLQQYKTVAQALRAYHGSLRFPAAGEKYIAQVLDQQFLVR